MTSVPQNETDALLQEKLDLHSQLFEAAQIQRKLSGSRALRHGDLQFASEVFAARYLSGDFTMLWQNGSKVLTAHGDIAGKGVAAGMWFTNLAGLLQSYGRPDSNPETIASEVNRHLCYLRPIAPFVTAFLAQIDCNHGKLTYCNAGHFPPILLRADGRTELLEIGGPLLGAIEGAEFSSGEVVLEPGDTLVAYSDGVLECCNPSGAEFGLERLVEALRRAERQSAHATLIVLLAALQDFANGNALRDDVSLTVIQRDAEGTRIQEEIPGAITQPSAVGSERNWAMQCANPQCSKELLYLREGRLGLLELESHADDEFRPDDGAFAMRSLPSKFFWLCGECAKTHIVKRWTTSGLVVVLRNQNIADSHPDLAAPPATAGTTRPLSPLLTVPPGPPMGHLLDRPVSLVLRRYSL